MLVSETPTSLPLLFSSSCSVLTTLFFLRPSFHLNLSGRSCLLSPPMLSGSNRFPDTHLSRTTTRLMSCPNGKRYSCLLQFLVVLLLLSLVFIFIFFSDQRRAVSSKFFDTQISSIFNEELVLFRHARRLCYLIFAATDTAFCSALISLGLAESRILLAAPAYTRPRTPLISFCTVQLQTLCVTRSRLSTTSGPGPGKSPGF